MEETMIKLGLKVGPHPEPYCTAWITITKLEIDKWYLVKPMETTMLDVLSLKLYRSSVDIWDHGAHLAGHANICSFFMVTKCMFLLVLKLKAKLFLFS